MKRILLLISLMFWLVPTTPIAAQQPIEWAGTDRYLRNEIGLSTELEEAHGLETEKRQAFDMTTGETTIDDPIGDTLSRVGTTQPIHAGWGDLSSVQLEKDESVQQWHVIIKPGDAIPEAPSYKTQYWIMFDAMATGNEYEGIRNNMDTVFMLKYFPDEAQWYTDFRWYNEEADFWAINKETTSGFSVSTNRIEYHIPFDELSPDLTPNWRVVAAIQNGGKTQIDAAPTVGFPPPKPEFAPDELSDGTDNAKPEPSAIDRIRTFFDNLKPPHYLLIGSVLIAGSYLTWSLKK